MSNSVRPHRQQPTRLLCLWDSPRKNTGVGCHFLPQCMKVKSKSEVVQRARLLATPWTAAYQAPPSMGFSRQEYWNGVPWTLDNLMWGQEHSQLFLIHCFPVVCRKQTQELSNCCPLHRYISPALPLWLPGSPSSLQGSHRRGCCLFRQREAPAQGRRQRVLRAGGGLAQRLLGNRV